MHQGVEGEKPEVMQDGCSPHKCQDAQWVVARDSRGKKGLPEHQTSKQDWPAGEQEVAEGADLQAAGEAVNSLDFTSIRLRAFGCV